MAGGTAGMRCALEYLVTMETDPSPAQLLSPEASRMRRSRERRRRGETVLTLKWGRI
jgi:hypothetical protein